VIEIIAALILLMIVGAVLAVESSNLLFSVIGVGAVGFLAAIAFVLLGAPDIAMVQVAVEVIGLIILLRATIDRDVQPRAGHRALTALVAGVAVVLGIALFGVRMFADFPAFGTPVMQRVADAPSVTYLQDGLAATGAPNIVTAVLLDFRGYDTLGEATVLFCAVLGAIAVLRRRGRTRGDESNAGADDE